MSDNNNNNSGSDERWVTGIFDNCDQWAHFIALPFAVIGADTVVDTVINLTTTSVISSFCNYHPGDYKGSFKAANRNNALLFAGAKWLWSGLSLKSLGAIGLGYALGEIAAELLFEGPPKLGDDLYDEVEQSVARQPY